MPVCRKPFRNERAHFYTLLLGVSCVLGRFIPGLQRKDCLTENVPSRELHSLATLVRLSLMWLNYWWTIGANEVQFCHRRTNTYLTDLHRALAHSLKTRMGRGSIFSPEIRRDKFEQEAGKTFFCASDVAKALGYVNPYAAVKRHCRDPLTKREGVVQKVIQHPEVIYTLAQELVAERAA